MKGVFIGLLLILLVTAVFLDVGAGYARRRQRPNRKNVKSLNHNVDAVPGLQAEDNIPDNP